MGCYGHGGWSFGMGWFVAEIGEVCVLSEFCFVCVSTVCAITYHVHCIKLGTIQDNLYVAKLKIRRL